MKNRFIIGIFFGIILIFCKSNVCLATSNYYPTTNVITTINKKIGLPNVITGLADNKQIINSYVSWEPIDEQIFNKPGQYFINGRTSKNEFVKAKITIFSDETPIIVSAIGDSITYGMNISNPFDHSYPSQLQALLGPEYSVINYGDSGKTLLKKGNDPYINTTTYKNSLSHNSDVLIIQLGSNDTKNYNFSQIEYFISDYLELLDTYNSRDNNPVTYIALPPTIFDNNYDLSEKNLNDLIPLLFYVTQKNDADISIIDNFSKTKNAKNLIPDGVHPNAGGASLLAHNVYDNLKGNTFETIKTKGAIDSFDFKENDYTVFKNLSEVNFFKTNNWWYYPQVK